MSILRTILRFIIILFIIAALILGGKWLFTALPQGINKLATATVSLSDDNKDTKNASSTNNLENSIEDKDENIETSANGLNGVYGNKNVNKTQVIEENEKNKGDIKILEKEETISENKIDRKTIITPRKNINSYAAPVKHTQYTVNSENDYYEDVYDENTPIEERSAKGGKNLKIKINQIGIIENNRFIATENFNYDDTISVHFTVINEEDTATGKWAMKVEMPAINTNERIKILQNLDSIPAESSYKGEIRFEGIDEYINNPEVKIYLDIYNQVNERNESDNIEILNL